jgi:diguanylate cyclase
MKPFRQSKMKNAEKRISGTVRSFGSRLFGLNVKCVDQPETELARYRTMMNKIGEFFLRHSIEPLPEHYKLIYRYQISGEPNLDVSVASLIKNGYLTPETECDNGVISAECLSQLAQKAQENLKEIGILVKQSGHDAASFSAALEGNTKDILPQVMAHPALQSLVILTQEMITKTRAAENELRLRAEAMADMQAHLAEASYRADTDALTGLSNRRAFERELGAAGERAKINGHSLSLAFCDIDFFKNINDTHGHDVGDRVLKYVGNILKESCGDQGNVARHGGEEFVILFEGITDQHAYEITDAARRDLMERTVVDKNTNVSIGSVTFSAGISMLITNRDVGSMLRTADRALYKAKASGRNCVVMAQNSFD